MIVTQTPLRISLFGGGTDTPAFYNQGIPGHVLSFTIDKYIYLSVNAKFDGLNRVSYSHTENVAEVKDIQHDLVRETLLHFGVQGLEITSVSDIPGEGSGLGSSSAFVCGLVKSLTNLEPMELAHKAFYIERHLCGHQVGKQDHYAAALGGINHFVFNPDESVESYRMLTEPYELESRFVLFYLGSTRRAAPLLQEQEDNLLRKEKAYQSALSLADMAMNACDSLFRGSYDQIGEMLDAAWQIKRSLARGISNSEIERIYQRARQAGASGGKVCGAGGGGFILFYVGHDPDVEKAVTKAVGLRRVHFRIVMEGSRVVYRS